MLPQDAAEGRYVPDRLEMSIHHGARAMSDPDTTGTTAGDGDPWHDDTERARYWDAQNASAAKTTKLPPSVDGYCVATDAGPIPATFGYTAEYVRSRINKLDLHEQRVVRCRLSVLEDDDVRGA
jgi:hypothetical protein